LEAFVNLVPPLIAVTKRRKSFTWLWKRKHEGRKWTRKRFKYNRFRSPDACTLHQPEAWPWNEVAIILKLTTAEITKKVVLTNEWTMIV